MTEISGLPSDVPQDLARRGMLPLAVTVDALSHYFSSAAHRPLVRQIRIDNRDWKGDESTFRVSARLTGASVDDVIQPIQVEIPSFELGLGEIIQALRIRPNHRVLAQIEEAEFGTLVVEVHAGDELIGSTSEQVELLAYNQLMWTHHYFSSMAAFITPNHPAVAQVMIEVRDHLVTTTGNGATQGYQSGSERAIEIADAIWSVVSGKGFHYTNPPASFEGFGQKVRTADIVISEQAATCLDSTMLFASLLAAAGLDPVLFMWSGHASVGLWMIDEAERAGLLGPIDAVNTNPNFVQDMIDRRLLFPFETTLAFSNAVPLSAALEESMSRFERGISDFLGVVDVGAAFLSGVRRIPSRNGERSVPIGDDVTGTPLRPTPPDPKPPADTRPPDDGQAERFDQGPIPARIRRWSEALLDLSRSNSLINIRSSPIHPGMPRTTRGVDLPVPPGALADLENRVLSGQSVTLTVTTKIAGLIFEDADAERVKQLLVTKGVVPFVAPSDVAGEIAGLARKIRDAENVPVAVANEVAARMIDHELTVTTDRAMRSLLRAAEDLEQQSASNQLYLCVGSLVWEEPATPGRPSGGRLRSPLYIVPVRIKGSARTQFTMTLDEGAEITPNFCLLEKLRSELNLVIPELEKPLLDDAGIDVDHAISAIRQHLNSSGHTEVRVDATASIALLDFASFRTWKDLRDNWSAFLGNAVVRHLVKTPHESYEDTAEQVDGQILCPIPCDESQLEAVRWAAEGRSFVLEGPPGTGKSQTIANLIAAAMALGKRVLFVAEKQVALEVVSRRLSAIGLDPFCIVIHHESITPDGIRQQLRRSLDFEGLDRSEEWMTSTAVIDAIQQRLALYRERLTAPNAIDHSLWKAHQELERLGRPTQLKLAPELITQIAPRRAEIEELLLQLPMLVNGPRVNPSDPWHLFDRADADQDLLRSFGEVLSTLDSALRATAAIEPVLEAVLSTDADAATISKVLEAVKVAGECGPGDIERLLLAADPRWVEAVRTVLQRCRTLRNTHREVLGFVTAAAVEMDLTPQMTAATEALNANFINRRKRAGTLVALLAPMTQRPEVDPAKVIAFLQVIPQVRAEKTGIDAAAAAISGFDLPPEWTHVGDAALDEIEAAIAHLVTQAATYFDSAAAAVRALPDGGANLTPVEAADLAAVFEAWGVMLERTGATASSLGHWRGEGNTWSALQRSLPMWLADAPALLGLQRWSTLITRLQVLRSTGLEDLAEEILTGEVAVDGLHSEFVKARAAASRAERLAATGLDLFERSAHDSLVEDLVRADYTHKHLMRTVIPRQLVDRRPFRPRVRIGDVGKLEAELSRKARRVSLPKLMRQHGATVTRLTPCFLMSPDAVSRLLPAEAELFDIVVFDEASQIKVANAIPAMGRARSVIVVGDSKQMPPSQRIGTRMADGAEDADGIAEGEDAEPVVVDLESILEECRESNLPSLMLKCHYRSRHEGLISFSNRYFYESELVTFPAPDSEASVPLVWRQVEGRFLRSNTVGASKEDVRTNLEEADAIAAEVKSRLKDPDRSTQSIGIVTFNEQQRWKILTKLSELGDPAVDAAMQNPDPERRLFVSALEQVQGDERDVIMFSIAFSYQERVNAKGVSRSVPLQFGPIANRGGERRLNVAVTRAKEEMVVFCSFDPNDLDLSNSQSVGLEMLKNFLLMARNASEGQRGSLRTRDAQERDHHRRAILEALRDAGITVGEELGLSKFRIDLAVSSGPSSGQFLAILLDGPQWASRSTAYDRDVLPESVLRGIGWRRIGRVWLPAHVHEPHHVVTAVLAELERERQLGEFRVALGASGFEVRADTRLTSLALDLAVRRIGQRRWATGVRIIGANLFPQATPYPGEVPTQDQLRGADVRTAVLVRMEDLVLGAGPQIELVRDAVARAEVLMASDEPESDGRDDDSATPEGTDRGDQAADVVVRHSMVAVPYVAADELPQIGEVSLLDSVHHSDRAIVRKALHEILEVESPILAVRLATLLANRCGLKKLRAARLETLLESHVLVLPTTDEGFGLFVWKEVAQASTWRGYRTSPEGSKRDFDQVAPEEVLNAMVDIVEIGHSALDEELFRQTLKAFGRKQLTAQAQERLRAIADWGIRIGRLHVTVSEDGGRMFACRA